MSKWPVLLHHDITGGDLDDDGSIRDEAVEGWITTACSAYLDRCGVLKTFLEQSGLRVRRRSAEPPKGTLLGRPAIVITSAGATEIHPTAFTISVRLRPVEGDRETPLNHACEVWLEGPQTGEAVLLGDDIRDELIALAHGAGHFN
jgi:hypothetical protein